MPTPDQPDPLAFETPTGADPQTWSYAITEGFKFPERFVRRCKELARWRGHCAELQSTLDFLVRNLISMADNLEETLAARAKTVQDDGAPDTDATPADGADAIGTGGLDTATATEADDRTTPDDQEQPSPPATGGAGPESLEAACVASAYRSVISLLENLGIVQVDLTGKTYETVTYNGQKVGDPFQVIEAKEQGPARQLPVREVVRSLWVQSTESKIRIVRQGKVCC